MATIVTRAGKGSALTWTEGDANITNLNTDKIELTNLSVTTGSASSGGSLSYNNTTGAFTFAPADLTGLGGIDNVVEDTTPQLGGNLDVNGNSIVSASNGNISIAPNGTGNILITPSTGKIVLGALDFPTSMGSNGQVLTTNGSSAMSWTTVSGGISNVVEDTTPQLGGNLDVNGNQITSSSNGNIAIVPNGTGNIQLTPSTGKITLGALDFPTSMGSNGQVLTTNGTSAMSWTTVSSGVTLTDDTSTNATRYLVFDDSTSGTQTGLNVSSTKLTFNPSTGILTATGFSGPINGTVGATTAAAGTFTTLTANTSASLKAITEGALYDLGTTGGTVAPNVANGNVQKITLNSALTINGFTSPVAGQSLTLIIYGGTSYTSITSTMKFAGGVKTLTATAGCIDILSVYYDGTNYFASLGKGFA
jgi:hypothetical protein